MPKSRTDHDLAIERIIHNHQRDGTIYERGCYQVFVEIHPRFPKSVHVRATIKGEFRRPTLYWRDATTHLIRWWQFWRISLEDAIEKACGMVDAFADGHRFSNEQIEQKIEEMKFRQLAIQELEEESRLLSA